MGGKRLTTDEIERIRAFREDGCPIREIARTIGRPVMTVQSCAANLGMSPVRKGGLVLNRAERKLAQELGIAVV